MRKLTEKDREDVKNAVMNLEKNYNKRYKGIEMEEDMLNYFRGQFVGMLNNFFKKIVYRENVKYNLSVKKAPSGFKVEFELLE